MSALEYISPMSAPCDRSVFRSGYPRALGAGQSRIKKLPDMSTIKIYPKEKVDHQLYGVSIIVREKQQYRETIERISWRDLSLAQLTKWRWYFQYRAALLRVKYPRFHHELNEFRYQAEGPKLEQILRQRVATKKRMLSQFRNKIASARSEWPEMFPIEDHPHYARIIEKERQYEEELLEAQIELENHLNPKS